MIQDYYKEHYLKVFYVLDFRASKQATLVHIKFTLEKALTK